MKTIRFFAAAAAAVAMLTVSCANAPKEVNVEEAMNALQERLNSATDEEDYVAILKEEYANHAKDSVGLIVFSQGLMYEMDAEAFQAELKKASKLIKENERVQAYAKALEASAQTAEGCMFKDFEGKTPEGEPVKLSDFVGKGSYVLADFWASWCGPCMRAIEFIREANETYAPKGLQVLGVAVWDGDNEASKARMAEKNMTWPQIFVGKDKTPTDIYGITGIPELILFAPDGTIVTRGHMDRDELMDSLAAIFNLNAQEE